MTMEFSSARHPCTGRRIRPLIGAVLCAGCTALAPPLLAAGPPDNADPDGDVVTLEPLAVQGFDEPGGALTSPRFTAPLIDTPQTVQVIPEDIFSQQGAQDLTDVLRNTPGISFSAGENGFAADTSNFNLRGFDTSRHIFIDGARDSGNYRRDIFDIEQVEVSKGPAADNGRGGPGGYINLVTKTPKLNAFNTASISYGMDEYDSDSRLRARIDVNRPLADGVALRVNVLSQEGGVPGREHARQGTLGVAPSLAFGLGSPTRVTLSYRYTEQDDLPEWGIPAAFIDDMVNHDPATREDDRDNFYGLASDYDDTRAHAATARIEHDLRPGLTLSNQTRWSETARDSRFTIPSGYDPDSAVVDALTLFYDRENSALSNITNLSFGFDTGALRHNAVVGLEFTRERSESLRFGSEATTTDIFNPDPFRAGAVPLDPSETSDVEVDTIALYAYDTVQLSERWQVTGGIRAERYDVKIGSRTITGEPAGNDGYEVDDTTLSGKLGVVYKPAEEGTLYGAVSLSHLPPGDWLSNTDISRTGNNAFPGLTAQNSEDAKTQQAINYEIGTKWRLLDERLFASVALFRTERKDVAIAGADEPGGAVGLQGYGEQIIQGIEIGATGRITEGWTAYGGLLFMDSERSHSAALDEGLRNARPGDFGDGEFDSTRGDELAFTPKVSATLWTTYSFTSGVTLGGGMVHVDDSWVGRTDDHDRIIPNGRFGELPGYTVFNAMASWAVNPNLVVRLNIDNITDELYAMSSNWPGVRVFTGAPRSYLLTADLKF